MATNFETKLAITGPRKR